MGRILTGTASWADPEFVKHWYPPKLPASQQLAWYARHFRLVEVNSTFYRIPDARITRRWADQTPDHFLFDVKLHRFLSRHSTKLQMLPPELRAKAATEKDRVQMSSRLERAVAERILKGIEPLRETNKLGFLLLQTSPEFSPRQHRLEELDHLVELFGEYTLAIELRNRGWLTDRLEDTRKFFEQRRLIFVMVDAPEDEHFMVAPMVNLVTHPHAAYLRAHGRNAGGYVRGRSVPERFDYVYPKKELKEIAARAVDAAEEVDEVHVVYNNNKADYAPKAGLMFQKLLEKDHPELVPQHSQEEERVYA
jgi:uncharacterized protein YecE (DUF72 family)